jgi:hypothetical protein
MKVRARLLGNSSNILWPVVVKVPAGDKLEGPLAKAWRTAHGSSETPPESSVELELPIHSVPRLLAVAAMQEETAADSESELDIDYLRLRMDHAELFIEKCDVCGAHTVKKGAERWLLTIVNRIQQAVPEHDLVQPNQS